MLFTGYSEHSIDAKQRLAVPAKYRNLWKTERDGHAWISIPWSTGHIRLYTEQYFDAVGQTSKPTLTPDRDTAELEARFYSLAERIEMDAAGRIILPKHHIELAGLKTDVAVIGAGNRLEIHDLTRWKSTATDGFRSLPELIERIQARSA
jgi:MraZ protein